MFGNLFKSHPRRAVDAAKVRTCAAELKAVVQRAKALDLLMLQLYHTLSEELVHADPSSEEGRILQAFVLHVSSSCGRQVNLQLLHDFAHSMLDFRVRYAADPESARAAAGVASACLSDSNDQMPILQGGVS